MEEWRGWKSGGMEGVEEWRDGGVEEWRDRGVGRGGSGGMEG